MKKIICVLLLLFTAPFAMATIDVHEFKNDKDLKRYDQLVWEIRCPKCQNNNIKDSNAPIAQDLRDVVYTMINNGKTNDEIKAFMVNRYGDFVLFRPPLTVSTLILWFGPVVLMIAGILGVWLAIRRRARAAVVEHLMSSEDTQRLAQLLAPDSKDKK